ncbi:hypothetical protein I7I53_04890 [Histoplasma capsulatum var. duboisii H88]|uniref:Uncharacterized protein n=1 Tax=Ajellomyces capsulatus (strain H88) TaxID=544711 RepID=A0A8A1LVQ1_AJEC8|nr:hypothetical protein I7I53_04890 [Histoplasma capsulatum var. duboisii H88]
MDDFVYISTHQQHISSHEQKLQIHSLRNNSPRSIVNQEANNDGGRPEGVKIKNNRTREPINRR